MPKTLNDDQIAARIVRVYFREIARLGFKRKLTLDEVINAYYYTLLKLQGKESLKKQAMEKVILEEKEIKTETKEELLPKVK